MRHSLATAGLVAVLTTVLGCGQQPPAQPHVLLITVDTLRADFLGTFGFPGDSSPSIDALAAGGAAFENAIAAGTMTAPSHASIMSSRFVRGHSIGAANGPTRLKGGTTLAEHFSAAGYTTAAFVTNVVLSRRTALDRGFATYDEDFEVSGPEARPGDDRIAEAQRTTERTLRWLATTPDGPLFAWVHYQDPHGVYTPPAPFDQRLPSVPLGPDRRLPALAKSTGVGGIPRYQLLPGRERVWEYAGLYAGEIAYVDFWIGRLIDGMRKRLGHDNLIVLLTADHGESMGESDFFFQHGHATTPDLAHVPLIISGLGIEPQRHTGIVSQVDISPTLLELAGLPDDPAAQGLSLAPLLRGEGELPGRTVFCDIGAEVSAYRGGVYTRARGGPDLVAYSAKRDAIPTPPLFQSFARDDQGKWRGVRTDQLAVEAIDAYARVRTPLAAAPRHDDEATIDRLRALGYLDAPPDTDGSAGDRQ